MHRKNHPTRQENTTMKTLRIRIRSAALAATSALGLVFATGPVVAENLSAWSQVLSDGDRWVVLAEFDNEAVLDRETQLVWARDPAPSLMTWGEARAHCLNRQEGGRWGWRLPSVTELASVRTFENHFLVSVPPWGALDEIIEWGRSNESLGRFWTATSVVADPYDSSLQVKFFGQTVERPHEHFAYSVGWLDLYLTEKRRKSQELGVVCVRGRSDSAQH
jgi:hypothetical protein